MKTPSPNRLSVIFALVLAGTMLLHAPVATAQDDMFFGTLPEANYPPVCGSTRSDAETAKLVALNALLVAEGVEGGAEAALAAIRHASLETLVVVGEGGNASLAAEPFDIALAAAIIVKFFAKAVLDNLEFRDDCIDSAEIQGSYERVGVLGGWINRLGARQNQSESQRLEGYLSQGVILTSLFLPQEFGGQLEAVRDLVQLWITNAGNAGGDVRSAQHLFDDGVQFFGQRRWRRAYIAFSKAYHRLVE